MPRLLYDGRIGRLVRNIINAIRDPIGRIRTLLCDIRAGFPEKVKLELWGPESVDLIERLAHVEQ